MCTKVYCTILYLIAAIATIGLISTASFAADGVAGEWNIVVDTQGEETPATLTIVEEDGNYSGTLGTDQGELELSEVSFDDSKLSFTVEIPEVGMSAFMATIEGDSLDGKFEIPDTGMEMITTGTRAVVAVSISDLSADRGKDMPDTTKYEFCSEEWVSLARDYLVAAVGDADFEGVRFSFSETFTDAPANLVESGSTSTGWYVTVANGELRVGKGILPDADIRITADYATVLPLARMVFEGNPEGAAEAAKLGAAAAAAGKMSTEGDMTAIAKVPALAAAFAKLHDTLARRTL